MGVSRSAGCIWTLSVLLAGCGGSPQPATSPVGGRAEASPTEGAAEEFVTAEIAVDQPPADLADPGKLLALFETGTPEDAGIRFEQHDTTTSAISGCPERFPDAVRGAWHAFNGEYYYIDPSSGRPSGALIALPPIAAEPRKETCQLAVGQWGDAENPNDDYDGGHMIGSQLGGWGARLNLVPQDANFNRGNWLQLENRVAKCGSLPPGGVLYYVRADYPDAETLIPDRMHMVLEIRETGETVELSFENEDQGGPEGKKTREEGVGFLEGKGCE
jgi:hypothetical protein